MVITALDMSRVKAHDNRKENKGKKVNLSANLLRFKVFVPAMFFSALQIIFVVNHFSPCFWHKCQCVSVRSCMFVAGINCFMLKDSMERTLINLV
jgi:uncharacterized membrane protein